MIDGERQLTALHLVELDAVTPRSSRRWASAHDSGSRRHQPRPVDSRAAARSRTAAAASGSRPAHRIRRVPESRNSLHHRRRANRSRRDHRQRNRRARVQDDHAVSTGRDREIAGWRGGCAGRPTVRPGRRSRSAPAGAAADFADCGAPRPRSAEPGRRTAGSTVPDARPAIRAGAATSPIRYVSGCGRSVVGDRGQRRRSAPPRLRPRPAPAGRCAGENRQTTAAPRLSRSAQESSRPLTAAVGDPATITVRSEPNRPSRRRRRQQSARPPPAAAPDSPASNAASDRGERAARPARRGRAPRSRSR